MKNILLTEKSPTQARKWIASYTANLIDAATEIRRQATIL